MDIAAAGGRFPDAWIDCICLDAPRAYKHALRDLYAWRPKLREGGLFVRNDFFESPAGARRTIGALYVMLTLVASIRALATRRDFS